MEVRVKMAGCKKEETIQVNPNGVITRSVAELLGLQEEAVQVQFMIFHRSRLVDPGNTFEEALILD
jgi:hypothetical protein